MKKGQSQIISTVLLILLVIIAFGLIIGFVVPFVKDKLAGGACLDVMGKIEINNNQYTCYSTGTMSVQIHILDVRDLIEGFKIELGGAESKVVEIINDTTTTGITMYGGTQPLEIPGNNGAKTYIIEGVNSKPDYVSVYPILDGGRICGTSDTVIEFYDCAP